MWDPFWALARLRTNDVHKTARISPFRVRGSKGGLLSVGEKSIVHARLFYERPGAVIKIGARTYIGRSTIISSDGVIVGDDVLISWDVTIVDHDSHPISFEDRRDDVLRWYEGNKDWTLVPHEKVKIGNRVWIGFGATILKGVEIGEEAVVAAQSVVTKSVASREVVAGNPARLIRTL